jgi:hypothetical protein
MIKSYSQLCKLKTFEDRFKYLKINGTVGSDTFGFDRYINQKFYQSSEWKKVRDIVIIRDKGCDLGIDGMDICGAIYVHHINPITEYDIDNVSEFLFNPENLICVSEETHNAIHYGNDDYLNKIKQIERKQGDTKLW